MRETVLLEKAAMQGTFGSVKEHKCERLHMEGFEKKMSMAYSAHHSDAMGLC